MADPPPPYSAPYPNQTPVEHGYPTQPVVGYPPQQPNCPPKDPLYPPPNTVPYTAQPTFQQQVHTTTVVTQQQPSVLVVNTAFNQIPSAMQCPFCNAVITTSLAYVDGTLTWLVAGVLCLAGCWPCCLIPFCVDDCKDVQHSCPNCHRVVGTFRRM